MLVLELLSAVAPLSAPLLLYVINYPLTYTIYANANRPYTAQNAEIPSFFRLDWKPKQEVGK